MTAQEATRSYAWDPEWFAVSTRLRSGTSTDADRAKIEALEAEFAPSKRAMTVHRMVSGDARLRSRLVSAAKNNEVWTDEGFMSTSKDVDITSDFAMGENDVRLDIRVPAGTPIIDVKHDPDAIGTMDQKEVILPRGSELKLSNPVYKDGMTTIRAEVVPAVSIPDSPATTRRTAEVPAEPPPSPEVGGERPSTPMSSPDPMPYDLETRRLEDIAEGTLPQALEGILWAQRDRVLSVRKRMELNPMFAQKVDRYADQLRDMADGATYIAVPTERIDRIIADGRFKTMHEKDVVSTGGGDGTGGTNAGYVSNRRAYENEILGVGGGKRVKPAQRPVYGYIGPRPGRSGHNAYTGKQGRLVEQYGDIHAELRPSARGRTTVSFSDSLNGGVSPVPVDGLRDVDTRRLLEASTPTDLRWVDTGNQGADSEFPDKPGVEYVEAQVHGGVKSDDIVRFHVSLSRYRRLVGKADEKVAEARAEYKAAREGRRPASLARYAEAELARTLQNRKALLDTIKDNERAAAALQEAGYEVSEF